MTAPVDICNAALGQMGAASQVIQGISPAIPSSSLAAQVATAIYQDQVDAVLRSAHWNCARFETGTFGLPAPAPPPAPLTLLKAAWGTPENPNGTTLAQPPMGYRYEYALPTDCLKARYVISGRMPLNSAAAPIMTSVGFANPSLVDPANKFAVSLDSDATGNDVLVLLTNVRHAVLVYTKRVANVDLWDPLLKLAIIQTLAAWFVNPLNRNAQLLKERVGIAVGYIEQARVSDGNEGWMSMDHYPDWLQVRNAGGYGPAGLGEQAYGGWDSIVMPDGLSY